MTNEEQLEEKIGKLIEVLEVVLVHLINLDEQDNCAEEDYHYSDLRGVEDTLSQLKEPNNDDE